MFITEFRGKTSRKLGRDKINTSHTILEGRAINARTEPVKALWTSSLQQNYPAPAPESDFTISLPSLYRVPNFARGIESRRRKKVPWKTGPFVVSKTTFLRSCPGSLNAPPSVWRPNHQRVNKQGPNRKTHCSSLRHANLSGLPAERQDTPRDIPAIPR